MDSSASIPSKKLTLYSPTKISENGNINSISEGFKTKIYDDADSKLILQNVKDKLGEPHPFDYEVVDILIKKFGLAGAVVNKTSDFTITPGIYVESEDEKVRELLDEWIDKTNLQKYLKPWFKEALAYGSGYLEIAGLTNPNKESTIKNVSASTMYVKRDEYGNVKNYLQYKGSNLISVKDEDIIKLSPDEIVQLNVNQLGDCAYGYGIMYSALETINHFGSIQKDVHQIFSRKANSQVHWKLGNVEKDDYPEQTDIDAFGAKLTFMNATTEFVTGPNAEAKVIDFGNIGEKAAEVLANDYKLLSYCFETPEVIMGSNESSGMGEAGKSNVQMDAYNRRIKSYQDDISNILREKVFDVVLRNNALSPEEVEYEICWGQLTDDDKNKKMTALKELLNIASLSPGMRIEIEKQLAYLLDIDYDDIDEYNAEVPTINPNDPRSKEIPKDPNKEEPTANKEEPEEKPMPENPMNEDEEISEKTYPLNEMLGKIKLCNKGNYRNINHFILHENNKKDMTIKEWIGNDFIENQETILAKIDEDEFENLRADSKVEFKAGYLNEKKIEKLREVLKDGFTQNQNLRQVSDKIVGEVKLSNLYEYNNKGLTYDEDGKRIKLLDKQERAQMITRTEMTRIANEAKLEDTIKKGVTLIRWQTAEDDRVCPECNQLDGQIFESRFNNIPPLHVNCRCQFTEIGTEEKLKLMSATLDEGIKSGKAPQELELELKNKLFVDEKEAPKLIESYLKLKLKELGDKAR